MTLSGKVIDFERQKPCELDVKVIEIENQRVRSLILPAAPFGFCN